MAENARNWGYPHPHTTVRLPGPPGRPVAPQVVSPLTEWDPSYTVPWERIDSERIDRERMKRMWTKPFLARRAGVGRNAVIQAIRGSSFPAYQRDKVQGMYAHTLQRIARALDLEMEDIVRREP